MEVLLILLRLWRRRVLVGIGSLAVLGLAYLSGPAPEDSSAVAWSRMLVDTDESQVLVASTDTDRTLWWRTEMLTHLLTRTEVEEHVARRAGVSATDLEVIEPRLDAPLVKTSLASTASDAAANASTPYTIQLEFDEALPLISFAATAPDALLARRLAEAMLDEFKATSSRRTPYRSPIVTAGGEKAELEHLEIVQVSPLRFKTVTEAGGYVRAAAMALIGVLAWCGCVALLPEWLRALRRRLAGGTGETFS